jgi:hypothetical protein
VKLDSLGLIEPADAPLVGLKVSALGREATARYWGVSQEDTRGFHPWPQVVNQQGAEEHSENALSPIQDHTRTVQVFLLGLFDAAWRLQKPSSEVNLHLDSIIRKRI